MKKILLILFLVMGTSCSSTETKKEDAFIAAAKGVYTLDARTEAIVKNDGDIYVAGVKTYDLDEVKTETTAVYKHEIEKKYYGFSIDGTNLKKTATSYTRGKDVLFTDLVDFATKK